MYLELRIRFDKIGYVNAKAVLDDTISELMKEGRTREQAIQHLYENPEERDRIVKERKDREARQTKEELDRVEQHKQEVKRLEEKIANLTVLYSQGEIGEESYKTALKTLEEEMARLKPQAPRKVFTVEQGRMVEKAGFRPRTGEREGRGWAIAGIIFGILAFIIFGIPLAIAVLICGAVAVSKGDDLGFVSILLSFFAGLLAFFALMVLL
ncbi:MAG: hypothetical protein PVH12_00180 [Candidatus Bathyarchaeota archaeon]